MKLIPSQPDGREQLTPQCGQPPRRWHGTTVPPSVRPALVATGMARGVGAGHCSPVARDSIPLRSIIHRLRERGIPSPSGKPYWAPSVLRDLLRRTVYTGTAMDYQTQQKRLTNGSHQRRWRSPDEQVALPDIATAIITPGEQVAVLARLDSNRAAATRSNRDPEATLFRAGFIYCGHCGNRLTVGRHPERGASYRCDWGTADRHNCPRPTIFAHLIDPIVWDAVAKVLRDPETIACEVERRREDGGLARDLAAVVGVTVKIWRPGATDDQGTPHPRWQIDLAPASASSPAHLVSGTACAAARFGG